MIITCILRSQTPRKYYILLGSNQKISQLGDRQCGLSMKQ
jgi:hypothetical protein